MVVCSAENFLFKFSQVENELILMSNIIKVLFCIAMRLQLKFKLFVSNLTAFV